MNRCGCGREFPTERALHRHQAAPCAPVPTCGACHKTFKHHSYLRRHNPERCATKRHICHACGARYSNEPSLLAHMAKDHPNGGGEFMRVLAAQTADAAAQIRHEREEMERCRAILAQKDQTIETLQAALQRAQAELEQRRRQEAAANDAAMAECDRAAPAFVPIQQNHPPGEFNVDHPPHVPVDVVTRICQNVGHAYGKDKSPYEFLRAMVWTVLVAPNPRIHGIACYARPTSLIVYVRQSRAWKEWGCIHMLMAYAMKAVLHNLEPLKGSAAILVDEETQHTFYTIQDAWANPNHQAAQKYVEQLRHDDVVHKALVYNYARILKAGLL